jgi:acid phosphatase type 7
MDVRRSIALIAVAALAGCGGADDGSEAAGGDNATTVWAVGDGAVAESDDDRLGGFLAGQDVDRLLYLGDVYETGTFEEFVAHYQPAFGRFKRVTEPIVGDHEWPNRESGYNAYWAAHLKREGGRYYYSFDLAGWHFVALNSQEPLGRRSRQFAWLRDDLEGREGTCTIVLVHKPRFNAGFHKETQRVEPVWAAVEGRAVAVLSGEDHNYQRFEPERGIVQFVVGTGGRRRYDVDERDGRLAASRDDTFGALRLRLESGRADYAFVGLGGEELDDGELRCREG